MMEVLLLPQRKRLLQTVIKLSQLITQHRRTKIKLLALRKTLAFIKENLSRLIDASASSQTAEALQSPLTLAGGVGPQPHPAGDMTAFADNLTAFLTRIFHLTAKIYYLMSPLRRTHTHVGTKINHPPLTGRHADGA